MMVVMCSAFAIRCTENLPESEPVVVSFNLHVDPSQSAELPGDAVLVVSAESVSGTPLLMSKTLELRRLDNSFTSEPVELTSPDLILTECVIASANGDILFAVPALNAPLAGRAPLALGEHLPLVNGRIGEITLLSVRHHKPCDFGLSAFKREQFFSIVVTKSGSNHALAATAYILQGADTLKQYTLAPRTNKIFFSGSSGTTYTLLIVKEAYVTHRQSFTVTDIARKTLRIGLQPALTITAKGISDTSLPPLTFYVGGESGTLTVDWGDGSTETKSLTLYETEFSHYYAAAGYYPVAISGDLDRVSSFYSFYGDGEFSDIRFDHLVNLNEIRYGLTACPGVIDLRFNRNLEFAMIPSLLNLETLYLPQRHRISFLEIDGVNHLDTEDIDAIIDNIYANTVRENITGGLLSLALVWYQEETDTSMVGPPSAAALAKLDLLRDNYGWQIRPGNTPVTGEFVTERAQMKQKAPRRFRDQIGLRW